MRRGSKILLALAMLLAIVSAGAPAEASYDPISSGTTTITLAKPFSSILAMHHVKVRLISGAKRSGGRFVFPASGGEVDPKLGTGTLEHAGTIIFSVGRRKVIWRDIEFKAKHAPLYAKVGGGQLKIATCRKLAYRRDGFSTSFSATGLRLTTKVATRLGKKLRLAKALEGGVPFGRIDIEANPATVHLQEEGNLSLAVDSAFYAKLNRLFVSLNPIAPAELAPGPTLSFPVGQESTLAPNTAAGTVKLGGSVELLQLGSAQVFWREVWLEPGSSRLLAETESLPSPPHPGKQPQNSLFTLQPGGIVSSNPALRTITLTGSPVTLTEAAASALNDAFGGSEAPFAPGEVVGSVSLFARGQ